MNEQDRKVAVVTGASAGLGKAAAKALAAQGWRVIALGRDPARSEAALAEIRREAKGGDVAMIVADLANMADAARAAREVAALTDRVDVLLNNAGGIGKERVITAEGNEAIFAGNHLGPFLLTQELLPLMRAAAARSAAGKVRIVTVSSAAADNSPGFNWDDVQLIEDHVSYPAYANAKLANLMFTRGLSRRLADSRVAVYAMHPGIAKTNFADYADDAMRAALEDYAAITVSAEHGADTLIWLATEPQVPHPSGSYFYRRELAAMNPIALDDAAVERLWTVSADLVARSQA